MIIDQCFGFPGEGRSFNFIVPEFYTANKAPALYRANARSEEQKKIAVLRRFDGSVDFDIISKKEIRRVGSCIT
jgi:hypothetical protein